MMSQMYAIPLYLFNNYVTHLFPVVTLSAK